jgi:hypothetical protein
MQFIALNGAPGCGKDTAGALIVNALRNRGIPALPVKFAQPLRDVAFALFPSFNDSTYEEFKRTAMPQLNITGRQLMIDISESFLKRQYGNAIMAHLLLARLQANHGPAERANMVFVITDCGFQVEVQTLADFGHDVVLGRMSRPGCTFKGDSRQVVHSPTSRESFAMPNDGTLDDLRGMCNSLVRYAVEEFGL